MPTTRQVCRALAAVTVVLFLLASVFNDHSNSSVDGILWWTALGLFVVLIAIGLSIMGRYLWVSRRTRSERRARSRSPR
ncbi:MAG: hypothetical protein WAL22_06955 [Solirubrobacteraceae bacterium]